MSEPPLMDEVKIIENVKSNKSPGIDRKLILLRFIRRKGQDSPADFTI